MKPLLVGETNPYGAEPEFALYPLPAHAAGGRLARILGMRRGEYLRTFDRVNLCSGRWSLPEARAAATRLLAESSPSRPLVLLGAKVAAAFGLDFRPFETICPLARTLILPHPSGRNRAWNRPGAAARARRAVGNLLARDLASAVVSRGTLGVEP